MSRTGIDSRFFNTLGTLERRTNTTDSIGDFTEVWNIIGDDIPSTIQPVKVKENRQLVQGKEYTIDKYGYIPIDSPQLPVVPLPGDRYTDKETSEVFDIVGVQPYRPARKTITIGHHYRLLLQIARANKS